MNKIKLRFTILIVLLGSMVSAQSCLPNGIALSSQSEVMQFAEDYPSCTIIGGDVTISGSDVVDLSPLSAVRKIDGALTIRNCPLLVSIEPLQHINELGSLIIKRCENLQRLGVFAEVDSLSRLVLERLPALTRVPSFDNLRVVSDTLCMSNIEGDSLVGFHSLKTVNCLDFHSVNCKYFRAFSVLQTAGLVSLNIPVCQEFYGFDSFKTSHSILRILGYEIDNFQGFFEVDSVGTSFRLGISPDEISPLSFSNLRSIDNGIIDFCGGAIPIGLKALEEVKKDLSISFCDYSDLDFLDGIKRMEGGASVRIGFNPNLTDISALDGIVSDSVRRVQLLNNPTLAVCHSDLVCDVVERSDPDLPSIVIGNAPGCTSIEEVLEQCVLKEDEEDDEEDPMADLCPMTSRPGMQVSKQSATDYDVLYSYGTERMHLQDVSYDRLADLIVHFRMEKEVFFDFETFSIKTMCQRAEQIAHGANYEYSESSTVGMETYVEQVISEATYLVYFAQLIDPGQCVKL